MEGAPAGGSSMGGFKVAGGSRRQSKRTYLPFGKV